MDLLSTALRTVLHVGCGVYRPDALPQLFRDGGWREVRLDLDPAARPDIVASITDMGMVESGSVDAVYSSHNLEHLDRHQVPRALAEFHRVLRPDGLCMVNVPDLTQVLDALKTRAPEETLYMSPSGPINALDILYGHGPALAGGMHYMAHRTAFTGDMLDAALRAAGFAEVVVARDQHYSLRSIASPGRGHPEVRRFFEKAKATTDRMRQAQARG